MLTSWNVGMSGVIGLRWETFDTFARLCSVPAARLVEVARALQVMEAEALRILNAPRR